MKPESIIASWINEDATRGFQLQADGTLVEVTREGRGYVWSPPSIAATLQSSTEAVEQLFVTAAPAATKLKVRVTEIKKGDRFWNEYWGCEVIAATDAYRLDGRDDPVNYSPTKPKPKRGQCSWNGTEWVRDWWTVEVGINNGKGGAGIWSEVEHRSIEVTREA